jgi:hypothetical protein
VRRSPSRKSGRWSARNDHSKLATTATEEMVRSGRCARDRSFLGST